MARTVDTYPPTLSLSQVDQNMAISHSVESSDLGFGEVVASESGKRLLNRDGSFNVRRLGLGVFRSLSIYHHLITVSWPRFLGLIAVWYLVINIVFAAAFLACGPRALNGPDTVETVGRLAQSFFFSVHTLATIGYGHVTPQGLPANIVVTFESFVGLLSFGLVAGLMFARVSRPMADIIFSETAVIAPYRGITGFEFRIVNGRSNQILELEAKIIFVRRSGSGGNAREFHTLTLERHKVAFFPLTWTIVHPIDASSPLYGATAEDLQAWDAEFLILLTGIDDTFSQTVHARSSYKAHEVAFKARFRNIFDHSAAGTLGIDIDDIHEVEPAA